MMKRLLLLLAFLLLGSLVLAQENLFTIERDDPMQDFRGTIENAAVEDVLVYLNSLQAGDTIYVAASGLTGDVAPQLILTDPDFTTAYTEIINAGNQAAVTLTYTVTEAGNYVLGMFSTAGGGAYRMLVAINDDSPLSASISSPVEEDGVPVQGIISQPGQVERFTGRFIDDDGELLFRFENVQAGDTLYVYAAGMGQVDTYVYLLDETRTRVFAEDDDSGGGFNSALQYQTQRAGIYYIGLITIGSVGNYELQAGINTPDVLTAMDQAGATPSSLGDFDCDTALVGDRPVLSGTVLTYQAPAFVIHYTLTGRDATTTEWVEELAGALQLSLDTQLNELGWALPPSDCGEGGDSRLDVYLVDMSDTSTIGYAVPENVVGDNPNTDMPEYYAAYSYLAIENDMEFTTRPRAIRLMRTTAAHEVHHNIQFGYDVSDRFFGFYEAGAAWIETLVFPTQTNVYEDAADVFATPDVCIGALGGAGISDLRIYGEWVMIDSFVRDLGLRSYQFIWEYMAANEGMNGFYRALSELETTPQAVILRMAVRNLLQDYALAKYFTETVAIETTINGAGMLMPGTDGVQQLAVDYVRFNRMGVYTVQLISGEELNLYVVGIDEAQDTARLHDLGQGGAVDLSPYSQAYLIILNTAQHADADVCQYTDWAIRVAEGADVPVTPSDAEIWDASQFKRPR